MFYLRQGAYRKSEPLLLRALEVCGCKTSKKWTIFGARLVTGLAQLYQERGQYAKAEPLLLRALEVDEQAMGPANEAVMALLNRLAAVHSARGAHARAESALSRAAEIQEQLLRDQLVYHAEPHKRVVLSNLRDQTDSIISLHAHALSSDRDALALALTSVLRRKGRLLDSLAESEATLRAHLTPSLRDRVDQLAQARADLAGKLYAPARAGSPTDGAAIEAIRTRIHDLEAELSAASAEFAVQSEPIMVARVQSALPRDAALIEFVRYRRFDPRCAHCAWQEERYVAYVVTRQAEPRWVSLGEAKLVDASIDAALAAMRGDVEVEVAKAALQRLDLLVLAPIRGQLAGVSHVILAPDGRLNLVPFEALVDAAGHFALEQYLVSYVTSGRDLLRLALPHKPRSPAMMIADPDYGLLPSPRPVMAFSRLDGTRGEAADLQSFFPTALTGKNATKSALAALTGPAMLHVATHGFYARDAGARPVAPARDAARGLFVDDGALQPRVEDPADALDRSGLAMAGANEGANGIVTAREIAGFDWWGTQLVVLSACETGVGAVPSGDGVYGLRRALVLAGAASQVVSLWSVSDRATQALMRDYYADLARGTGRAEALRQTKLRLMRQPGYAHPYYWAAFIPAGDWRPLDRDAMHRPR